ncbi:BON domain-containing protein [Shewanella putrefaciens]|uniref:BON domain-containing protein n=1 Tax=Shewanella putrefaciens TaxID=24 RepID=UPI000E011A97|nr:BON domain-containing protein [Shewanella putrefaciens]SUI52998.1 Osmotically-inducible protein Y precursor [Shewanella putrefaciens]
MNLSYRKFIFTLAILLTLSPLQSASAADTATKAMDDVRQESQIATSYALNPYLRANDLKVTVQKGKAVLTGQVDEKISKELAGEIAQGVSGIKDVDNQIVVDANYMPKANSNGFGDKIDDANISAAIRSKLQWNKDVDDVGTEVMTKSGRVSLNGTVNNQNAKDITHRLALNTRGVKSVTNNLKIQSATVSKDEKAKLKNETESHNISDSWITAKVKSSFMYSSNINGSDIDVSTNNGIVTLTGKVASGSEQSLAVETAQNIRGVKSVTSKALTF